MSSDGAAPAQGWVAHLRDGGTTPWPRWVRDAGVPTGPPANVAAPAIPGAAQLELLRRLNELGPVPHRADHVLSRPGPGRGPVHLALPLDPLGPAAPRREVLRVAAGVLADLTAQLPPPRPVRRRSRPKRPRPVDGLPAFVLEGPPVTAAEVRARLAAAGMPEHRPRSSCWGARRDPGPELVVVLAAPLDEALRQAWAARVQRGAGRAWPRFVTQWAGRGTLPPSAAVHRTAGYWAARVGSGNVHVVPCDPVVDPADPFAGPAATVAELLGHPLGAATPPADDHTSRAGRAGHDDPVRLAPAVVDVLRRVNVVLPFVCSQSDRPVRRTALVGLMREVDGRPEPADLPERQRAWARTTASRIVDALRAGGFAHHGELDALRTVGAGTGRRVGGAEVLDAMVRMIHRVDAELVGGPRDGRGGR